MSSRNFGLYFFSIIAISAFLIAPASAIHVASHIVIDFETDDDGVTPLANGQHINSDSSTSPQPTDTLDEFGNFFDLSVLSGSGGHLGAAIFDSDPNGPNAAREDQDLLVDTGNVLMLQDDERPDNSIGTNGLVFDYPDDEAAINPGSIIFNFTLFVEPLSIDIVDANGGFGADVIMTDAQGDTRTYTIPEEWTYDIADIGIPGTALGYGTLDLTETVSTQPGENTGIVGLPVDVGSFDANLVVTLEVKITGSGGTSGGIDNLTFNIPEPTSSALVVLGVLAALPALRRRARKNA